MKVAPTLNGGLRIDADDPADWEILRCILLDARLEGGDLAGRLGALVRDEPNPGDWEDYVVPGLRSAFDEQLDRVEAAIEQAFRRCDGGPGPLLIEAGNAETWYGALNQARLGIEERHGLGAAVGDAPPPTDPVRRSAHFRSQFYLVVQGMLLDRVIPGP